MLNLEHLCDDDDRLELPFNNGIVPLERRILLDSRCFDLWSVLKQIETHIEMFQVPQITDADYKEITDTFYRYIESTNGSKSLMTPLTAFLMQQLRTENSQLQRILAKTWQHDESMIDALSELLSRRGHLVYVLCEAAIIQQTVHCVGYWEKKEIAIANILVTIDFTKSRSYYRTVENAVLPVFAKKLSSLYESNTKEGITLRDVFDRETFADFFYRLVKGQIGFDELLQVPKDLSPVELSLRHWAREKANTFKCRFGNYVPFEDRLTVYVQATKKPTRSKSAGKGTSTPNHKTPPSAKTDWFDELKAWKDLDTQSKQWLEDEREYRNKLLAKRLEEAERYKRAKTDYRNREQHEYETNETKRRQIEESEWVRKRDASKADELALKDDGKNAELWTLNDYIRYMKQSQRKPWWHFMNNGAVKKTWENVWKKWQVPWKANELKERHAIRHKKSLDHRKREWDYVPLQKIRSHRRSKIFT